MRRKCKICGKEVEWDKDEYVICSKCYERIWDWDNVGTSGIGIKGVDNW